MRFHNFKNCWMNEFTHWFIHHLFSPLTYIRFGEAFLGVWVLDRQILTMKNFSFLKTLLPVCGIGSLLTQGGIRHPARLKVFHAHSFRIPGAPVLLFYHSLLSAPEGSSLAYCEAGAGICGLHLTLRQNHIDVVWSCVRNLFQASAFFYNWSRYNSFLLGALLKEWLKVQNKAGEVWLGLDAQCYNLSDILKSTSRIPPDFISLPSHLSL